MENIIDINIVRQRRNVSEGCWLRSIKNTRKLTVCIWLISAEHKLQMYRLFTYWFQNLLGPQCEETRVLQMSTTSPTITKHHINADSHLPLTHLRTTSCKNLPIKQTLQMDPCRRFGQLSAGTILYTENAKHQLVSVTRFGTGGTYNCQQP
jgi:hypothetical protein